MRFKIWPWSRLAYLTDIIKRTEEKMLGAMLDRDNYRDRSFTLEARVSELKKENAHLSRRMNIATTEAKNDLRAGLVYGDNSKADDLKYREVKRQAVVMKKMNKQAAIALRYVAKKVKSNAVQSDLVRISELIEASSTFYMDTVTMSSADMVHDTVQMGELVALSNGEVAE